MNDSALSKIVPLLIPSDLPVLAAIVLLLGGLMTAHHARAGESPKILRHASGGLQTGRPQDSCAYARKVVRRTT